MHRVCSVKKMKGKTRDSCPLLHSIIIKETRAFVLGVLAFLHTIYLVPHLPGSLLLCTLCTLLLQILFHFNKEQINFCKSQYYWFPSSSKKQLQKALTEIQVSYWRNKAPHLQLYAINQNHQLLHHQRQLFVNITVNPRSLH